MHPSLDHLPAEALRILRAFRSTGELAPGRSVTIGALRASLVCERDGWYGRFRRGLTPLLEAGLVEERDKPRRGPALRYVLTTHGYWLLAGTPARGPEKRAAPALTAPAPR